MTQTKTIITSVAIALLIVSAGCSAFAGGNGAADNTTTPTPTPEQTPEPTETPTPEPTATETPVATEEPEPVTETDDGELSKAEKFEKFDQNVKALYGLDENISVETETFPENDSYHITYQMRDTYNETKTVNDRTDPLWTYYVIVEDYNDDDSSFPERDHTYIPDTVNVTFVTQDGEVFETYYIKYNWAYKYYTGDWSIRVFMGQYGSTVEEGPGYHENR